MQQVLTVLLGGVVVGSLIESGHAIEFHPSTEFKGNADYLNHVVQPFDANHRSLLEIAPDHVCLQGKTDKKGRQCHPLLAGYSRDMDTGSVCVELVSDPPQFKVTFEGTGDWALVKSKFWAGSSIEQVPTYPDEPTEINLEDFDYFYSNYTGYKSWTATAPMTETCDADKEHFRVSMVTHAEVEQVDVGSEMCIENRPMCLVRAVHNVY